MKSEAADTPRAYGWLGLASTAPVTAWVLGAGAANLQGAAPWQDSGLPWVAALGLAQVLALTFLGPLRGRGPLRQELVGCLVLVGIALPTLVLAWLCGAAPAGVLVGAEAAILLYGGMLALCGQLLRRAMPGGGSRGPIVSAVRILATAAVWGSRTHWLPWIGMGP